MYRNRSVQNALLSAQLGATVKTNLIKFYLYCSVSQITELPERTLWSVQERCPLCCVSVDLFLVVVLLRAVVKRSKQFPSGKKRSFLNLES